MYSFEIGYMCGRLRVVTGENVGLETFEEVYGGCSNVVYVILVIVSDDRRKVTWC